MSDWSLLLVMLLSARTPLLFLTCLVVVAIVGGSNALNNARPAINLGFAYILLTIVTLDVTCVLGLFFHSHFGG